MDIKAFGILEVAAISITKAMGIQKTLPC